MHYRFGPFQLDTRTAQLLGPDGEIALRPMSLRLLQVLIEQAPNLLTHEQLLDQVWGRQAVSVGVVAQSVRELRRALGESVQAPAYIETRHRLGYRFMAAVERVEMPPGPPVTPLQTHDPAHPTAGALPGATAGATPIPTRPSRTLLLALSACAVVVVLAIIWHRSHPREDPMQGFAAQAILFEGRPRDPDAATAYVQGLRALSDGDLHGARAALQRSLERAPESPAAAAALAEVLVAAGEFGTARKWATAAARLSEGLPRIERLRLEGFAAGIEGRWSDAVRPLQAVFELQPGDAETGIRLFDAQLAAGQPDAALATLAALAALKAPQVDPHRLALAQARAAVLRGDHRARLAAGQRAQAQARTPRERIEAWLEQAWALLQLGDGAAAAALHQDVQTQLAAAPWPAGKMRAAMLAGALARVGGEFDAALAHFAAAGAAAEPLGQRAIVAAARRESAFVLYLAGRLPEAREALRALETEVAELGNRRELASTLDVASLVEQRAGDMDAARTLGERALQTYVEAGDRVGEASVRGNLGMLLARSGRLDDAEAQIERALALFRAHGDRRGAAVALGNLAAIYARSSRAQAAREANEQALSDFRALESTLDVARVQFNLGLQDRRAGRLADTEKRFREALDGFTAVGASDTRLQVLASLAELLLQRADLAAARELLEEVSDLDAAPPQRRAAIESARARLALLRNALEDAEAGFRAARALREEAGLMDWVQVSELDLAELAARRGALVEAERAALQARRALLEARDPGAAHAGLVLAGVRSALGEPIATLLDAIEAELGPEGDMAMRLRLDLTRAARRSERRSEGMQAVADEARRHGFELLALRAELLSGGAVAANAAAQLSARGVELQGVPPGLPF